MTATTFETRGLGEGWREEDREEREEEESDREREYILNKLTRC